MNCVLESDIYQKIIDGNAECRASFCSTVLHDVKTMLKQDWKPKHSKGLLITFLEQLEDLKGLDICEWLYFVAQYLLQKGDANPSLEVRESASSFAFEEMEKSRAIEEYISQRTKSIPSHLREEVELVKRIQSGDKQAAGELYRLFYPRLRRAIDKILQDKDRSHDIVQEALLKSLEKIDKYTPGTTSIYYWLYVAAKRRAFAHGKKRRGHREKQEQVEDVILERHSSLFQNPESVVFLKQLQQRLLLSLEQLEEKNPKYAQVVRLRFYEQKSLEEIAQILNTTKNNISKITKRALEILQQIYLEEKNTR